MLTIRVLTALAGVVLVLLVVRSALRTFVVPRGTNDPITRTVFLVIRVLFGVATKRAKNYAERDAAMALYAPVSLLALPVVWLMLVLIGYAALYWGIDQRHWTEAVKLSGSSLLTLGFSTSETLVETVLAFSEAGLGLTLAALLVAYLPTIYAAWSRREEAVALLEVRAGSPPTAAEMIIRFYRIGTMHKLTELWVAWEVWFVNVAETHTSLTALNFFRSPSSNRSWVTAAGTVLDAAALMTSVVDAPRDPFCQLCLRAGFLALRDIARLLGIRFDPDPRPDDPISIGREEFDAACERMAQAGVPLTTDRDQAWHDFAGWRVNYDRVLLALAAITMAPEAPWSSDRSLRRAAGEGA